MYCIRKKDAPSEENKKMSTVIGENKGKNKEFNSTKYQSRIEQIKKQEEKSIPSHITFAAMGSA